LCSSCKLLLVLNQILNKVKPAVGPDRNYYLGMKERPNCAPKSMARTDLVILSVVGFPFLLSPSSTRAPRGHENDPPGEIHNPVENVAFAFYTTGKQGSAVKSRVLNLLSRLADEIQRLLMSLHHQGMTLLIATHNYRLVKEFPARTLALMNGQVVDVDPQSL
jgi:hypothetical protein